MYRHLTMMIRLLAIISLALLSCADAPQSEAQQPSPPEASGARSESQADAARQLAEWRTKIDEADRELVALLNRRAGYVLQLAPLKKQIGVNVQDPKREEQVLRNLSEANAGPLSNEALHKIYGAIMVEMRDLQSPE